MVDVGSIDSFKVKVTDVRTEFHIGRPDLVARARCALPLVLGREVLRSKEAELALFPKLGSMMGLFRDKKLPRPSTSWCSILGVLPNVSTSSVGTHTVCGQRKQIRSIMSAGYSKETHDITASLVFCNVKSRDLSLHQLVRLQRQFLALTVWSRRIDHGCVWKFSSSVNHRTRCYVPLLLQTITLPICAAGDHGFLFFSVNITVFSRSHWYLAFEHHKSRKTTSARAKNL